MTLVSEHFQKALDIEDWDLLEDTWLLRLDVSPIPTEELLEVRRQMWGAGKKVLAMTLLELLAESLESANDHRGAVAALREIVRLRKTRSKEDVERLKEALMLVRAKNPSLKGVLEKYDLLESRRPIEALDSIELLLNHDVGTVVEVIGQGVGRVVDVNLTLENVKVDIGGRRPVSVPFGAVSRFIRRLPEGTFLRLRVEQPDELAVEVAEQPCESLVKILESLGEPADVGAIKNALGDLLAAAKWNSWWTKARKHPRVLSSGTGSRLRYSLSQSAESASETLLEELREADPRERLGIARKMAMRGDEAMRSTAAILGDSLAELEDEDPGVAWETAGVLSSLPEGAEPAQACRERLLMTADPGQMLAGIKDRSSRIDALNSIRENLPDDWTGVWSNWLLHEEGASNLTALALGLVEAGAEEALDQAVESIIRNHLTHPTQFMWGLEIMTTDSCPAPIKRRMTPSLLEKIPDTLSRSEYSSLRGRAKGLLEGGKIAVRIILESASPQQATRFTQRITRIQGVEPQRTRLLEQATRQIQTNVESTSVPLLVATEGAIEAKRAELKQMLEVEIPKTLKGINAAAAEGDLRENFEYHMLRDRQELQSARAARLQEDLNKVRTLEPGSADTSQVNIGTVVHLESPDGGEIEPVTILGTWDADVDRRIFANGTELAQALLGHKTGDEVTVEGHAAKITDITAWTGG